MSKQNENETKPPSGVKIAVTKSFERQLDEFLKDTSIFPERLFKKDALTVALNEFEAWHQSTDPEVVEARKQWFALEPPDHNQSETVQFYMGFSDEVEGIMEKFCQRYNVSRRTMAYSIVVWWFKSKVGPRHTLEDSTTMHRTRVMHADHVFLKMLVTAGRGGFKTLQEVCLRAFDQWLIWRQDYDADLSGPVEYRALPASTETELILVQMPHILRSQFAYWAHMDQMKVNALTFNAISLFCQQLKPEHKDIWNLLKSQGVVSS